MDISNGCWVCKLRSRWCIRGWNVFTWDMEMFIFKFVSVIDHHQDHAHQEKNKTCLCSRSSPSTSPPPPPPPPPSPSCSPGEGLERCSSLSLFSRAHCLRWASQCLAGTFQQYDWERVILSQIVCGVETLNINACCCLPIFFYILMHFSPYLCLPTSPNRFPCCVLSYF